MNPRISRIGRADFSRIMATGGRISAPLISMRYLPSPDQKKASAAVVVAKKVISTAVGRNTLRRRAFASFRALSKLPGFSKSPTAIFFFQKLPLDEKKKPILVSSHEIRKEMEFLLRKAGFMR